MVAYPVPPLRSNMALLICIARSGVYVHGLALIRWNHKCYIFTGTHPFHFTSSLTKTKSLVKHIHEPDSSEPPSAPRTPRTAWGCSCWNRNGSHSDTLGSAVSRCGERIPWLLSSVRRPLSARRTTTFACRPGLFWQTETSEMERFPCIWPSHSAPLQCWWWTFRIRQRQKLLHRCLAWRGSVVRVCVLRKSSGKAPETESR